MTNRAERRAQAKRNRRGEADRYSGGERGRAGLLDEAALQARSRRLSSGQDGEWKPSGHSEAEELTAEDDPGLRNPKAAQAPHTLKQWLRLVCWVFLGLSALAFVVCMWFPRVPMWAIITMVVVFGLGVIGLFFTGRPFQENPNLDSYGTAV
ncbi:tripartite tricarboxylate transporter TctB family protein [Bifidobacterium favimelis]|uniref:Tripartite tricarboxylate transporter TctB family protein n=1 Tax=Bifidobacterium favimelis TaxID=3122979 RepID=A0ABU8ZPV2_9BIFI